MMQTIKNRLYVYIPLVLVAIFQNFIHEALHYLLAIGFGEGITEFRFLTNGWGTSQVIYAAPMEARAGFHWLVIGWGPAVITTLLGLLVYWQRRRWLTTVPWVNLVIWYLGALFMTIDPLYYGVVSWFMQGSDVNAAQLVGWPAWPFQLLGLAVAVINIRLVLQWREQARGNLSQYRTAEAV